MKRVVPSVCLLLLTAFLAACLPEGYLEREREKADDSLCLKRGGDYDKCRASIAEESAGSA